MRRTSFTSLRSHHVAPSYGKSFVTIQRKKFTTNFAKNQPTQSTQAHKATTSESPKSTSEVPKVSVQPTKKIIKVLISGAGLAGLTCARALKKKGIEAVVIDNDVTDYSNNGIIVHFPAQHILNKLGIYSQVQEKVSAFGNDLGGTYGYVEYGKILPSLHHDVLSVDTPSLLQILSHGVNVKRKSPIKTIEQTENGISVRTRNSVTPDHFDVAIIADEVYSKVRSSLFAPEDITVKRPGYLLWEVIMDRPDSVFPAHNIECWGERARLGFLPLGNNKLYVWGTFHTKVPLQLLPEVQHRELKEASEFYSQFEGFGVQAIVKELTTPHKLKCSVTFPATVKAKNWVKDRAVLIGDAAHAYPPNNTYGPLLAIEDGYVLGTMLSEIQDTAQIPSTLQQFYSLRKSRVDEATKHSDRADSLLGQTKKPFRYWLKTQAMTFTCNSPMLKQKMKNIVNFNPEPRKY